jgi:antitoxin YefM
MHTNYRLFMPTESDAVMLILSAGQHHDRDQATQPIAVQADDRTDGCSRSGAILAATHTVRTCADEVAWLKLSLVRSYYLGYNQPMRSVPLGEAKDKLSALVDDAQSTHDIIAITKHGRPAAVLMSADDLESLQETLFWLSQPGIRDDIAAAEREYSEGMTVSGDALREEFGLPPQR